MNRKEYEEILDDVVIQGQKLVQKMTTEVAVDSDEGISIIELSGYDDSANLEASTRFGDFVLKVKESLPF